MSEFLDPPALIRPVVIHNDGGGLVKDYELAVNRYTIEGREVQIKGSCRSACILSLAVPNVCVYPSAVVKAHQAYEADTGIRRPDVTARMLSWLPTKIQYRLSGKVTATYTSQSILKGDELIALGIRKCGDNYDAVGSANNQNAVRKADNIRTRRTDDHSVRSGETGCKWEKFWLIRCLLRL